MKPPTPTLLVIRLSALGDVAMTVPAIYAVARLYPQWKIKVLTSPFFSRIFVGKPNNVELLTIEHEKTKGFAGLFRLIHMLRKEDVTCVADFHNMLRSWIIDVFFVVTGHKVVMINKDRMHRRQLTKVHKQGVCFRPFCLRYFDVLQKLGFKVSADSVLPAKRTRNLPHIPSIGIAPFARYRNKTYPLDKMRDVVRLLSSHENVKIYLFGSKGAEQAILEEWVEEHAHATCVAGQMPIEEEIALMSRLDVMLTMDSANMHLASLVGTPVVSVWGSTTPECGFLGWGQKRENCIVADCPCQPCTISGSNSCRYHDFHCLTALSPQQICEHINRIISLQ